jgi:4-amino-4-deoxy-L-arabinose transferase-like glycosyltransferase
MMDERRSKLASSAPWALLAVIAAIVFVAYVRLRVAGVPLERDEGEYAYAGRLILEGVPPYQLAYNMKFPGTYYAYALILAVLGKTAWGIHAGLLLVNAVTIVLVFLVGRRLLSEFAGAAAAVVFAILTLDRWVYGVFAHATHFVILAAIGGLLVLLRAFERERLSSYFASGLLFGVALVMKQHAVVFLPFCAALVLWVEYRREPRVAGAPMKRTAGFALGSVVPLVAVAALLAAQGVAGRFWFWTFRYAREYVSEVSPSEAFSAFALGFGTVTTASLVFWVIGAIGLAALWVAPWEPRSRVIVTGLLAASFVATCPGFYFREHYFVLMLPAVALLVGAAVGSMRHRAAALAVLVGAIGLYAVRERSYLFSMGPRELSRAMYGSNPFVEAVEIGSYIKQRTDPSDRIAVLGSEPEIYFYADRKAATGYIYTYALMEPQRFASQMQAEMIKEVESAHPRYLVFVRIDHSWLVTPSSDQRIVGWARDYAGRCYDLVGVADLFSEEKSGIVWDDAAQSYEPQSDNLVYTFRRKGDDPCTAGR